MTSVKFESVNCIPGDLVNVKITSYNKNSLFGFHTEDKAEGA